MPLTPYQLQEAARAMGMAEVFVGIPTVEDGMGSIGQTEGEIGVEITEAINALTTEQTGNIAHQASTTLDAARITVTVVMGDPDLWAKLSASGASGGGFSYEQPVQEYTVLVIPHRELGGGLTYEAPSGGGSPRWVRTAGRGVAAAEGADAAPKNAIWLWRAYPMRGPTPFKRADGGKVTVQATFNGMIDVSKPEGLMVACVGDPFAQGVTDLVF
jgi:hypothetical protein